MFLGSCFHWRIEAEWRRVSIHSIQTENNRHAPANQRTIAHLGWPTAREVRSSWFVVRNNAQTTSQTIYTSLSSLSSSSKPLPPCNHPPPLASFIRPHPLSHLGRAFQPPTSSSSFRLPPSAFNHHGKFCIAFISSAIDSMVGADYPGASLMILLALLCCSSRRRCLGSHRPGEWRYRANKYPRPLRG